MVHPINISSARRVQLAAQRGSFPLVGEEQYQCTDPTCQEYHQQPLRSKHVESMQAHYQQRHEGKTSKTLELLCKDDLCDIVRGTYGSWLSHRRDHKHSKCPVRNCSADVNGCDMLDHLRDDHLIGIPKTDARDARFYRTCKTVTRTWEQNSNESFDHQYYELRERKVFDPDSALHGGAQRTTEADITSPAASSSDVNERGPLHAASENAEKAEASASKDDDQSFSPVRNDDENSSDGRSLKTKLPRVTQQFLTELFQNPEELRSQSHYKKLATVFLNGSFVRHELFQHKIPRHDPSVANDCLMLASIIMWLEDIDPRATLDDCLQEQFDTIADFADAIHAEHPPYKIGSNDAYYDFLYGLYVRAIFYPDNVWFVRPGSEKLAQLIYDIGPKHERDGMKAYTDKTKNMKPLVLSMRMDLYELTNVVWTNGLELWLKNYDASERRTLGDYLGEVLEKEVRRVKVET